MTALENFSNMYDIAMKPLLLHSLLRDQVPDEKRTFRNPSKLLQVVSTIKAHGLLSERYDSSVDQLHVQKWKSAVDSWVDRLLMLVCSDMPDKCWAGISLLGVTCEECHSDRILASYSAWFPKLLLHIQSPVDSHIVKSATCTTISDLFTRLGGVPSVKKDCTSHAGKVVQPVLKLLNEDSSESVWEGAIHLLCTVLAFFPSSVHRHSDSVEAAIILKMKSGKCCETILKKLAQCLALLPKSRGDEGTWILMMHKILLSINLHLNDAFQGLEDETKRKEAMRLLAPPGKEPPPPLGGHTTTGEAMDMPIRKSELMAIQNVSTLMLCCSTMLTSYYPVQVSVPVSPLLALVGRVLMVDGSVSQSMYSFMSAMQQQLICSQLPVLHMYSLDLVTAIIKGLRSQLLPHAAAVVRLLTEYFRKCALPELRIKVYSIVKILLISMGVGIAVYLAPEIISSASLDLNTGNSENHGISNESAEALLQPWSKKRKQGSLAGSHEEKHKTNGPGKRTLNGNLKTPNSVKIAALEALESLLNVGCASGSESWRSNVDLLLMTVATYACGQRLTNQETNISLSNERTSTWEDFQLASLRALLASLLSRARVRPPYLAQGLELFHRGKQVTGTSLSEFCAHALLALEVLMHPRARALGDFDEVDTNGQNQKTPISYEDGLDDIWQENGYHSDDDNGVKERSQNVEENRAKNGQFDVMDPKIKEGPEVIDEIMREPHNKTGSIDDSDCDNGVKEQSQNLEENPTKNGQSDIMDPEINEGPQLAVSIDEIMSEAQKLPRSNIGEAMMVGNGTATEAEPSDSVAEKEPRTLTDEDSDDFPPIFDVGPDSDSD